MLMLMDISRFEVSKEWGRGDRLGSLDGFQWRLVPRIMLVHDAHFFRGRLNDYSPIDRD